MRALPFFRLGEPSSLSWCGNVSCLLSYLPTFLLIEFGDEFFVVASFGAPYGVVGNEAFQCFLSRAIVGVAKDFGKLVDGEFFWQSAETFVELVCSSSLHGVVVELVVVVLAVQ